MFADDIFDMIGYANCKYCGHEQKIYHFISTNVLYLNVLTLVCQSVYRLSGTVNALKPVSF